jgi:flavonoid 3'-monooxygenase
MFLRMGSRPTLIVSNDKMARELLRVHDNIFASRPLLSTGKHFGYNYTSVVFSPSGANFVRMKKIYTHELLSPSKVELLSSLRMEEVRVLLGDLLQQSSANGVVNVTSLVFKANLNLMGRIIFSKRLFGDSSEVVNAPPGEIENFKFFVKSATRLVGLFNIGDYIPALRWLDLQGD